jgi:protein-tyrosine phosphatase
VRLNTTARRIVGVLAVGALVTGIYVAATEVIEIYACGFEKLTIPGVPNAGRINAHLYRGGQPTADGLAALRSLGIDTIVSFTLPGDGALTEADEAHALGLQYVHLPWSASALPPVEYLARFLRMTAQGQSRVVFVHCKAGADRTGLMIAAYRVLSNGWTPDDALYEMNAFGYEVEFHPQLRRFVRGLTPAHTPGDVVAMAPVVQAPDTAKRRASVMP